MVFMQYCGTSCVLGIRPGQVLRNPNNHIHANFLHKTCTCFSTETSTTIETSTTLSTTWATCGTSTCYCTLNTSTALTINMCNLRYLHWLTHLRYMWYMHLHKHSLIHISNLMYSGMLLNVLHVTMHLFSHKTSTTPCQHQQFEESPHAPTLETCNTCT